MNCLKKNTECFMYVTEPMASVLMEMNRSKLENFFLQKIHLRHYLKTSAEKKKIITMHFLYIGHH